jgi:NADPH:quinone reductase-like Zn-dependent oxidoreductase
MLARAAVVAGEQVLVCGASGGVGSAAVQLAKRRGAIVTAIAAADKLSAVAACGADRVISRDTDTMAQFGAEHFHVVIDSVGGDQFGDRLDGLKRGGRYAVAGAIAGPIVSFDLRTLYLKDLRLIGCTVLDHGVFANLVRYIEAGEVMPLVSGVFPLSDIVAAQTAFLTKQHVGKIVLVP